MVGRFSLLIWAVHGIAAVWLTRIGTASRPTIPDDVDPISSVAAPIRYTRFSAMANNVKSASTKMGESVERLADMVDPMVDASRKYNANRDELIHAAEHFEHHAIPKAFVVGVGEKQKELKNFLQNELFNQVLPGHLRDLADSHSRNVTWKLEDMLDQDRMNEKLAQKFHPDNYARYPGHGDLRRVVPSSVVDTPIRGTPYGGRSLREIFDALREGPAHSNLEQPNHIDLEKNHETSHDTLNADGAKEAAAAEEATKRAVEEKKIPEEAVNKAGERILAENAKFIKAVAVAVEEKRKAEEVASKEGGILAENAKLTKAVAAAVEEKRIAEEATKKAIQEKILVEKAAAEGKAAFEAALKAAEEKVAAKNKTAEVKIDWSAQKVKIENGA